MNDINNIEEPIEEKKIRVALYIRVSTDEQEKGQTHEIQISRLKKYIESREDFIFAWDDYVYEDLAVSWADEIEYRLALTRLFEDLEYTEEVYRPFDSVIVYRLDRFARNLKILLNIIDKLNNYWVNFISSQESIDTSTPFWNAMIWIIWTFAELERELIKDRTQSWIERSIQQWIWKNTKYWYIIKDKHPEVYEQEAKVVKTIFDLFVYKWKTVSQIAKELTKLNYPIPSKSSKKKRTKRMVTNTSRNTRTVKTFLEDRVYVGEYWYNKSKYTKQDWKRKQIAIPKEQWKKYDQEHIWIIDKDTFAQAQLIIESNRNQWRWDAKIIREWQMDVVNYLLQWKLKCSHCAKHRIRWKMSNFVGTKSNWYKYYQCNWKTNLKEKRNHVCETTPIPKDELEKLVIYNIKKLLNNPNIIEDYIKKTDISKIRKERLEKDLLDCENMITKYKEIEKRTIELYNDCDITRIEYENKNIKDKEEINKLRDKKKELKKEIKQTTDNKKYKKILKLIKILFWDDMDIFLKNKEKTYTLIQYVIKEIIIYSRPKREWDRDKWWRRKEGQMIPYHLKFVFNLPQTILTGLMKQTQAEQSVWDWDNILLTTRKYYKKVNWKFERCDGIDWIWGKDAQDPNNKWGWPILPPSTVHWFLELFKDIPLTRINREWKEKEKPHNNKGNVVTFNKKTSSI